MSLRARRLPLVDQRKHLEVGEAQRVNHAGKAVPIDENAATQASAEEQPLAQARGLSDEEPALPARTPRDREPEDEAAVEIRPQGHQQRGGKRRRAIAAREREASARSKRPGAASSSRCGRASSIGTRAKSIGMIATIASSGRTSGWR